MQTINRVLTAGVCVILLGSAGCVIDREHADGRYEDQRHGRGDAPDRDRDERRAHDDRCLDRDHDRDCRDR
jgi:hypothetical protein